MIRSVKGRANVEEELADQAVIVFNHRHIIFVSSNLKCGQLVIQYKLIKFQGGKIVKCKQNLRELLDQLRVVCDDIWKDRQEPRHAVLDSLLTEHFGNP